MLIFMHSDWLYKFYNQSECLKISVAQIYAEKLFIVLGPGVVIYGRSGLYNIVHIGNDRSS